MIHRCAHCGKKLAREKKGQWQQAKGVRLVLEPGRAPRAKCVCGRVVIFLKGEA